MKKILITGSSGFLALYLIERLSKDQNLEIYGITEIQEFTHPDIFIYHIDIRDKQGVMNLFKQVQPDLIFHLAAISNVGFSWKNQSLTYEVNISGSANILEAMVQYDPKARIILMSSGEIYQSKDNNAIDEQSPIVIKNPYSLSKYTMELMSGLYETAEKIDVIRIRAFNFIGPRQDRKFVASDFAYQIAEIEKGHQPPYIKVGNLAAKRDFSDVRDVARYLEIIAFQGDRGETYNLCSGECYSIDSILRILLSFSRQSIQIIEDPNKMRPADTPVMVGDCSKLRNRFNLIPQFDIKQTLFDILQYWRNQ